MVKEIHNVKSFQFVCRMMKYVIVMSISMPSSVYVLYDLHAQMENSMPAALVDPPFKGLARTSDPPFFWNGLYPGLFPSEVN